MERTIENGIDDLDRVMSDRRINSTAKIVYRYLWIKAGRKPAWIAVGLAEIADKAGRRPSHAGRWLKQLAEIDLIAVGPRTHSAGALRIHLFVFRPCPGQKQVLPDPKDPQMLLPLDGETREADGGRQSVAESANREGKNGAGRQNVHAVFAEQNPRDGPDSSPELSLTQQFLKLSGDSRPPPASAKNCRADIRYRNQYPNQDIDIGTKALTQGTIEKMIRRELPDPALQVTPVAKMALAVTNGDLDWEDIKRAIDNAKQHVLTAEDGTTAVHYFLGAVIKHVFPEHGLNWKRYGRNSRQPA